MAKEIKLKKSFGSVTIDRFSPKVPEGMPKAKKAAQRREDAKTRRKHFLFLPLRLSVPFFRSRMHD